MQGRKGAIRFDLQERPPFFKGWSRGISNFIRQAEKKMGARQNFSLTSAVEDLRAELKHITQRWKRKQQRCS